MDPLAPVSLRVLAAFLTSVTWLALSISASLVVIAAAGSAQDARLGWFVLAWSAPYALSAVLIGTRGWDPGKLLLRLRVVGPSGGPPGVPRAALRVAAVQWPLLVAWSPGPVGAVAGWAYLPWLAVLVVTMRVDDQRRGWHDRLAGTRVVVHTDRGARPLPGVGT